MIHIMGHPEPLCDKPAGVMSVRSVLHTFYFFKGGKPPGTVTATAFYTASREQSLSEQIRI